MTSVDNIFDRFHRALFLKLQERRSDRVEQLANGGAVHITGGQTVAENYAAQVAYIKALEDVNELCAEVEREIYGEPAVRKGDA